MKTWNVVLPIGGHAFLEVEAESEEEAIEKAMEVVTLDHVEEWNALEEVASGNVVRFPSPWNASAEEVE